MQFVFPQLVESIVGLVNDIPLYINNLGELFNDVMTKINLNEGVQKAANENWNDFVNYICNKPIASPWWNVGKFSI